MYRNKVELYSPGTRLCRLYQHDKILSFRTVMELWQHSENFCLYFNDILSSCPFEAYFWEVKLVTTDTLHEAFEFALIDSPELVSIKSDFQTFSRFFNKTDEVVSFPNLGGDSMLIAPCPQTRAGYASIARFARTAPAKQVFAFWNKVGSIYQKNIDSKPLWLSTSGLGVYWLHVRLDRRPKYYIHGPYKN